LYTLNKTVSLVVSDAATATKTSQSSILIPHALRLSDFNKGITYLRTYFQSRDPGIGKQSRAYKLYLKRKFGESKQKSRKSSITNFFIAIQEVT